MKRRVTKLVMFLLLGAIVNVAVAWVRPLFSHWNAIPYNLVAIDSELAEYWESARTEQWPRVPTTGMSATTFGWNFRIAIEYSDVDPETHRPDPKGHFYSMSIQRVGLPLYSLTLHGWLESSNSGRIMSEWHGGLEVLDRRLPIRPIWPGFAINTLFYAAILWLLTLGPFTARRMIRRKRGHCIKCGYDLRGHSGGEVCPECGQELCEEGKQ